MSIQIRLMKQEDVETCGRICYEAFKNVADYHNFRPDFPTPAFAVQFAQSFNASPQVFGVVAESDGQIVGSNYLWEYDAIRAVGPITVDPSVQSKGAGRKLMEAVIERGNGSMGIRLVQDSFNMASLSLYASLGFDVKEPHCNRSHIPARLVLCRCPASNNYVRRDLYHHRLGKPYKLESKRFSPSKDVSQSVRNCSSMPILRS